jgi:hypothetical protein
MKCFKNFVKWDGGRIQKVIIIALLLSTSVSVINAQDGDIELPMKFLTFKNARLSLGISLEFTPIGDSLSTFFALSDVDDFKSLVPASTSGKKTGTYQYGIGLTYDVHSPFSRIGFAAETNFLLSSYFLGESNNYHTHFNTMLLEVPLLLKVRSGKASSKNRVVIQAGPTITVPLRVKINKYGFSDNGTEISDKKIIPLGTGLLVYGQYERTITKRGEQVGGVKLNSIDNGRFVMFGKFHYRFTELIDTSYNTPIFSGNSNSDYSIKNFYISIGAKYYFRLKAY